MRLDPYVLANELSVARAELADANKRVADLLWADECKGKQIVEFNEALITVNAELARLIAEIERLETRAKETTSLLNALFVFRDNANAEIARLRTALAVCVKELDDAHNFVQAELDARIATHTFGGDFSTLDEADGGLCGEAMDCLERIDAARDAAQAALTRDA